MSSGKEWWRNKGDHWAGPEPAWWVEQLLRKVQDSPREGLGSALETEIRIELAGVVPDRRSLYEKWLARDLSPWRMEDAPYRFLPTREYRSPGESYPQPHTWPDDPGPGWDNVVRAYEEDR